MIAVISPAIINGEVFAPASKSAMQRACALALMNNGTTTILNPGVSNDDMAAQDIIRRCGVTIHADNGKLCITSNGSVKPEPTIHCGESGLSVRMFTPIIALGDTTTTMTGEGSLLTRPMNVFETVLPQLGVSIRSNAGFLPMDVHGPVFARDCIIDGSKSSQYVTGILFALAKSAKHRIVLTVSNLTSRPYVDLSLQMLEHFGYEVENKDYQKFVIHPSQNIRKDIVYLTEGDWSGAAFLLVAAAISGKEVFIKGLDYNSKQADKAIIEALHLCGAAVEVLEGGIKIHDRNDLKAFEFDATQCPDLFPPLTALAVFCQGETIIHGTSRLINKESNRLAALIDVFTRMGAHVRADGDAMHITGGQKLMGADVDGHHDHRIVMACAIAALRAGGEMTIGGAEAIDKSYPHFFSHLKLLGAAVSLS